MLTENPQSPDAPHCDVCSAPATMKSAPHRTGRVEWEGRFLYCDADAAKAPHFAVPLDSDALDDPDAVSGPEPR